MGDLQQQGYAVIDAAFNNPAWLKKEVLEAKESGFLAPSEIGGRKQSKSLRGDLVGWFDGRGDEWVELANWLRMADGI